MTALAGLNESLSGEGLDENYILSGKDSPSHNIDGSFNADDSEAETERLHESPAKKRIADEADIFRTKKLRIAGRNLKATEPEAASNGIAIDTKDETIGDGEDDEACVEYKEATRAQDENSENSSAEAGPNDSDVNSDNEENEDEDGGDRISSEERMKAIKALSEIEVDFAHAKDSLHDQQIAKFDLEIQMCSEGIHPELEQYQAQIKEECEARLARTRNLLKYQMNAIFNSSRSGRCSLYQTFFKNKFAIHSALLNEVTRKWYQINFERRKELSGSPEYGYVATSQPCRIQRPTNQSMGVTELTRLLNMPLAPHMPRATDSEREEDLHDLGLR